MMTIDISKATKARVHAINTTACATNTATLNGTYQYEIDSRDTESFVNYNFNLKDYSICAAPKIDNVYNTLKEISKEKSLDIQVKNLNHRVSECMTLLMELITKINKLDKKLDSLGSDHN